MRVAGVLTLCCLLAGCVIGGQEAVPLRFKFVTSGQSSDLVSVFSQTIQGNSLRPLAPANVRGTRDSEGNLLIEWTRRTRIGGGLRPFSEVPLAEETEHYEVEILNGSNVVLRTIVVDLTQGEPAVLIPRTTTGGVSGNSIDADGASDEVVIATTQQMLDRVGSFMEARLVATPVAVANFANFGVIEPQYASIAGTSGLADLPIYRSTLGFTVTGSPTGIRIFENAVDDPPPSTQKFVSGSLGSTSAIRVRAVVNTAGIDYYWDFTGPGSVPFYRSDLPAPLPVVGMLSVVSSGAKIDDVFVGFRQTPSTMYEVEKQVIDFGSAQASIRVRVYQVSAVVGRGPYTQADL